MSVTVKITGDKPGTMFNAMTKSLPEALKRGVFTAATVAGGAIVDKVYEVFPQGRGRLARSFLPAKFVVPEKGGISAAALSDLVYAGIQDEGGTIFPKTARLLAQPVTPEAKKQWPRDWPGDVLFMIRSKNGKLLLVTEHNDKLTTQYILHDSVTITGKGYVEAAEQGAHDDIVRSVLDAVDKGIDDAAIKTSKGSGKL